MSVGLLGKKIGMTQVYDESGVIVPVTVLEAGPCAVLQVRTQSRDGYDAVQLGFDDKPRRLARRSERGHVASIGGAAVKAKESAGIALVEKADCEPKRFIREFRCDDSSHGCEVGQQLNVQQFEGLDWVDVIGISKGRGFAGVMKRHNFAGMPASHGAKRVHRRGGSIGMSADPARVLKGTRMAGRFGGVQVTVRGLRVVSFDAEHNVVLVRGAVPGPNGGYLVIRKSRKRKAV